MRHSCCLHLQAAETPYLPNGLSVGFFDGAFCQFLHSTWDLKEGDSLWLSPCPDGIDRCQQLDTVQVRGLPINVKKVGSCVVFYLFCGRCCSRTRTHALTHIRMHMYTQIHILKHAQQQQRQQQVELLHTDTLEVDYLQAPYNKARNKAYHASEQPYFLLGTGNSSKALLQRADFAVAEKTGINIAGYTLKVRALLPVEHVLCLRGSRGDAVGFIRALSTNAVHAR